MTKQIEFSVTDSFKKLEKSLENIGPAIESEINAAVKDVAYAAYASIMAKAQAELKSTRQDYIKGLEFIDLGDNNFVLNLDGDVANAIEDGYASFNMLPGMLASTKTVDVGTRSGQSWVQQSKPKEKDKQSHKFAHVPFERKPFSAEGTSNMAEAIQQMTAVNARGRKQKITSVFENESGVPLEGKVAIARSDNPLLDGLVKYQKTYINESTGKKTTQSVYINYRTISENGKPWMHPGWKGLKAFEDAEKEIVKQLDQIIKTML